MAKPKRGQLNKQTPSKHLVVMKEKYLEAILQGEKKIEIRLTKNRCAPFGRVSSGDQLYLKVSSGPVCGIAEVKKVKQIQCLTPESIREIRMKYGSLIGGSNAYWTAKEKARYGVLIWLKNVSSIIEKYIDKSDRRPWVILKSGNGYGLI